MIETESFQIEGLAGERRLEGQLIVKGAKNAALKALAASLLFKDGFEIHNVPAIEDIARTIELLRDLGVVITAAGPAVFTLKTDRVENYRLNPEISKRLRASIVLTGPLLARLGRVAFPYPGGCVIGKRPIDIFLEGFTALGATIHETGTDYELRAPQGLIGAELFLKTPSVTATETFLMAGVLANGRTVIKNAALEPEIESVGQWLKKSGAKIEGLGTPTITIIGSELLSGANIAYTTLPDRIEAGSFLILAALLGKDIEIKACEPNHLDALLHLLRLAGVKFEIGRQTIRLCGDQPTFTAVDVKTHEYPGFPTDLQAPLAVFLTQARGQSFIFETIFEGRLGYLETLARFGGNTRILDAHRAIIEGPLPLIGREVESPDLRAGLAYILAALVAAGESIVHNVYCIDRGYERIDERLKAVGAPIRRAA